MYISLSLNENSYSFGPSINIFINGLKDIPEGIRREKYFIMDLKKKAYIVKDLIDGILVPSIKTMVKTVMQHTTQILFSIVIA